MSAALRGSGGRSRGALVAGLACVSLVGCGGSDAARTTFADGGHGLIPGCVESEGGMPLANLGPDLTLRALCGTGSRGAIASVNQPGAGVTRWSVSLDGDAQFVLEGSAFVTCEATGPTIANVDLQPAPGAVPGDTYEAVATITAEDDAFPTTEVALHGEVVAPNVTAPSSVDFGDVPAGTSQRRTLRFDNASPSPVALLPSSGQLAPFTLIDGIVTSPSPTPNVSEWTVSLDGAAPGDYTAAVLWTATPSPVLTFPAGCLWTQTITLHAHVVAVADAGPDASRDGGASEHIPSGIIP
ncbi:MAG TPA: hypothetical protein VHL80_11020 [Polyangia bacterium]|nr:hypothetical protein [Polyangia bacterium]